MPSLADLLRAAGSGLYGSTGGFLNDTGVSLANLGRAAYGYGGSQLGLLAPSQLPDLIDPASVPGTTANVGGILGVGDSPQEKIAQLVGGLFSPGGKQAPLKAALTDNPVVSAVVRFGGKEYDNPMHFMGIKQALEEGTLTRDANGKLVLGPTDSINLFRLKDGRLITRDQAGEMFGAKRTEDLGM